MPVSEGAKGEARSALSRGGVDQARFVGGTSASLRFCSRARMRWPLSFRAEVDLLRGHIDKAAERFESAFALGCQLADPCWEGIAERGLGLVAASRGQHDDAIAILVDTLARLDSVKQRGRSLGWLSFSLDD